MLDTPRYEYSRTKLQERISLFAGLSLPYGLTVRYAVKANPFVPIIELLHQAGIHFDASSSYEASLLLSLGIPGHHISLSSQQRAHNLSELIAAGVRYTATSRHQLEQFLALKERPAEVGLRINPPVGYGHNNRTSTGGVNSSFGVWHEQVPELIALAAASGVVVNRVHIHVGSGADPSVWMGVMDTALSIVEQVPGATTLDIGGGYKVHRFGDEKEADMVSIVSGFSEKLQDFYTKTGREIALEIEPGTFMVAHCGTLVARVDDIVSTGPSGHTFLRLNTGMNDFLRSTLYGAQHMIEVMSEADTQTAYVVVGHNCESGDILTPAPHNPEEIAERLLRTAQIGDEVRIYDTGAYCASMRARGYNSFPDATEVMVK
jgi:diaminopimelate decarboxylase